MAWSSDFLAACASPTLTPQFILEVVKVWNEPGLAYSVGSHPGLGTDGRLGLRGVVVQGSTLSPRSWTTVIGAFSAELVGDVAAFGAHVTRGTIVALRLGFEGMAAADFERIAVGQFRNRRGVGPSWSIEVLDLPSACRQRLEVGYTLTDLFANVANQTTLSVDYTVGDATLQVASTTAFDLYDGTGAVKITPTTGDPFYLTYTGTASGPTRFTGVSAAGVCGTTAVAAVAGDAINDVVYLSGHPLDIARKLLVSRGDGNGSYDVYPYGAGIGLLDELIDHDDIDAWKADVVKVSAGSYSWQIVQEESVEDAWAFLADLLSRAGLYITTRQGRLTVRAAQPSQSGGYHSGIAITDDDIEDVEDYEAFDANHSPEYNYVLVSGATFNSGAVSVINDVATLPRTSQLPIDLSDRVFANEVEICNETYYRLEESAHRVPERLVVRCAGLRLAQLACGDLVDLTTQRVHSRRYGEEGFVERPSVVEEVSPDPQACFVRVALLVYPEDDDVFS